MHRFVCRDASHRSTNDKDAMNADSDAAVDSVEAVGFSTRSQHTYTLVIVIMLVINNNNNNNFFEGT